MPEGGGFFDRITGWFKQDDPQAAIDDPVEGPGGPTPPPEAPEGVPDAPIDVGVEPDSPFGQYQPDLTNALDADLTPRITLPDDPGEGLDEAIHDDTVVQDDDTNDVAEVASPPPPPDLTNALDAQLDEGSNPGVADSLGDLDLDLELRPGPPLPDPEPTYEVDLGPDPLADLPTEVPIAPPEVGDPTMDTGIGDAIGDGLDDLA